MAPLPQAFGGYSRNSAMHESPFPPRSKETQHGLPSANINDLVQCRGFAVNFQATPTLAILDGIKIMMYYADHEPAHFHAIAGEDEILIGIADISVIAGDGPPGVIRRVRTWARRHQGELALCWVRCRAGQKPGRIEG